MTQEVFNKIAAGLAEAVEYARRDIDGQLTPAEFGEQLIQTRDLDPVYVGLVGAGFDRPQVMRWLLCYWCFYHAGVACAISTLTGAAYWDMMRTAAENKVPCSVGGRWPRAAERRHFRGPRCVSAINILASTSSSPEGLVESTFKFNLGLAQDVMREVEKWPMFGNWIAFKAADMIERCLGVPLQFPRSLGLIYEQPRAALGLMGPYTGGLEGNCTPAMGHWLALLRHFERHPAPPAGDRPCGPQEVETVLCKWKSYQNGHYWVGKDIHEVRAALAGWGNAASAMMAAMPPEVPRS